MHAQKESEEQKELAKFLRSTGWLWCHVPNGGWRNIKEARNLQAMGVSPGVPDILIFERPNFRPEIIGVAIELKTPGNRPTLKQVEWIQALRRRGWHSSIVYSAREAIIMLENMRIPMREITDEGYHFEDTDRPRTWDWKRRKRRRSN